MAARDRVELVDIIVRTALAQFKEAFPRKIGVDQDAIGVACGVPFVDAVDSYNNPTKLFEKIFDEDFPTLVRATIWWLAEEGYLVASTPSEIFGTSFTLSERGARHVDCLPLTLKA